MRDVEFRDGYLNLTFEMVIEMLGKARYVEEFIVGLEYRSVIASDIGIH